MELTITYTPYPPPLLLDYSSLFLSLYTYYKLVLFDILSVRSLVVILAQCSALVGIEQMTRTSEPPPYDPPLFRRVTLLSSSCHSKNLFSVNVFIFYHYHRNIPPQHPLRLEVLGRSHCQLSLHGFDSIPALLVLFSSSIITINASAPPPMSPVPALNDAEWAEGSYISYLYCLYVSIFILFYQ